MIYLIIFLIKLRILIVFSNYSKEEIKNQIEFEFFCNDEDCL